MFLRNVSFVLKNLHLRLKQCAQAGIQKDIVTTNNSESMHAVFKRFENGKEVDVDRLVFEMYRLQLGYCMKLNRSIDGFKPYTLVENASIDKIHLPCSFDYGDFLTLLPEVGDRTELIPEVTLLTLFSSCTLTAARVLKHCFILTAHHRPAFSFHFMDMCRIFCNTSGNRGWPCGLVVQLTSITILMHDQWYLP